MVCALPQLPRIVIEVGEGFPNSLGVATRNASDFQVLDSQLANIYSALLPLSVAGYQTDALLYPTFLYNATAPGGETDPLKRAHPALHHILSFFETRAHNSSNSGVSGIGVFLEAYSSGIMTQQVGGRCWVEGCLPRTPLTMHPNASTHLGLSMDIDTVIALKQMYPKALTGRVFGRVCVDKITTGLAGVRFHEVYGCDSVWRADGGKDCFQMSPDVFQVFIDGCASAGLIFFHNDNSHLLEYSMTSPDPWSYHSTSPSYYAAKVMLHNTTSTTEYAAMKLGARALLSYETNNGFPTADLAYFKSVVDPTPPTVPEWMAWDWVNHTTQFPLRNRTSGWGISNQPWAWSEWEKTLTGLYSFHGEMMSPVEMLQQISINAVESR